MSDNKKAILNQITEYIEFCYDNNIRGFRTKTNVNYRSYQKSSSNSENTELQIVTDLKNRIKSETNKSIKDLLNKELLKHIGNRSDLRKRWGSSLKVISLTENEYKKATPKKSKSKKTK